MLFLREKRWLGLYVLLLAGFVTIFDLFVINVAIVNIQQQLKASFTHITLIIAGYEIAFGALLITGSRLGDKFGRRKIFQWGMLAFTLASFACAIAIDAQQLIIARIIQGIASAILFPQVYAAIRVNFNPQEGRIAFSLLGMTLGMAAIAGQLLGGWLISIDLYHLQWRTIFLVNLPIGIIALLFSPLIKESFGDKKTDLDIIGVILSSSAFITLLTPLLIGQSLNWPLILLLLFPLSLSLFWLFIQHEKRYQARNKFPLVDLNLLKNKSFLYGCILVALIYATASSFFLAFALLSQQGFGLTPLEGGLIFAPANVGFVIASLLAPILIRYFGYSTLCIAALIYSISFGLLIWQIAGIYNTHIQLNILIPTLCLLGFSQGLLMTPLINLVMSLIAVNYAGIASGIISTLQQMGAAFGVAIVSLIFHYVLLHNSSGEQSLRYSDAFINSMLFNFSAIIIAFLLLIILNHKQKKITLSQL